MLASDGRVALSERRTHCLLFRRRGLSGLLRLGVSTAKEPLGEGRARMNEARAVPCDTYSQRSAAIWQTRTADVVLRPVDGCVSVAVEGLALELMGLLWSPDSFQQMQRLICPLFAPFLIPCSPPMHDPRGPLASGLKKESDFRRERSGSVAGVYSVPSDEEGVDAVAAVCF